MNAASHPLHARALALLDQREAELRARLETSDTSGLAASDGNEVTDFKESAARESDAAVQDAQSGHAAAELVQVQAARQRLADGTYGVCRDCGSPIAGPRLLALPAASRCGACQSIHERSASRRH